MLGSTSQTQGLFDGLLRLAAARGAAAAGAKDPLVRQRLAELEIAVEAIRWNAYRNLTSALRGRAAGIKASVTKLATTRAQPRAGRTAIELMGRPARSPRLAPPRGRRASGRPVHVRLGHDHRRRHVADPEEHHRAARPRAAARAAARLSVSPRGARAAALRPAARRSVRSDRPAARDPAVAQRTRAESRR